MFTLSGLLLEDGENLFRDFWRPFSIYFWRFSAWNLFKKKFFRRTELGRGPVGQPCQPTPRPDRLRREFGRRTPLPPSPGRTPPPPAPCPSRRLARPFKGRAGPASTPTPPPPPAPPPRLRAAPTSQLRPHRRRRFFLVGLFR